MAVSRYILIVFLFSALWSGCDKKDLPDDLWGTEWRLEGFVRANGDWVPNETGKEIRLDFQESAEVEIQLPVNTCGVDVLVLTGKKIRLGPAACTEVCCDPEYALECMGILTKVLSYYVKKNKLYLQGPQGSVILVK